MLMPTQQHKRDETNVNFIMKRFKKSGQLPNMDSMYELQYRDVSNVPDFMTMRNQMIKAEEAFLTIPPTIRRQFDNDPVKFLQFIADPQNKEKGIELGIFKKKEELPPDYQKMMVEELQKLNKSKESAQSST